MEVSFHRICTQDKPQAGTLQILKIDKDSENNITGSLEEKEEILTYNRMKNLRYQQHHHQANTKCLVPHNLHVQRNKETAKS